MATYKSCLKKLQACENQYLRPQNKIQNCNVTITIIIIISMHNILQLPNTSNILFKWPLQ